MNVITFTKALKNQRELKQQQTIQRVYHKIRIPNKVYQRKIHFARWVESLSPPEIYVFNRVVGPPNMQINQIIQVKFQLMPCLKVGHTPSSHALLDEPFEFYGNVTSIKPYNEHGWQEVEVTIRRYPSQKIVIDVPEKYYSHFDEILERISLPVYVQGTKMNGAKYLNHVTKTSFQYFHMIYHPSSNYNTRFGIIDAFWKPWHSKTKVDLPSEFDFGALED